MNKIPALLNNTHLKIIAIITMVIDHICLVLFPLNSTADIVRLTAGRISMPIFAFLLVEGFFHTKNRFRYGMNLLIFAIISEPVFDLAHCGSFFSLDQQNVLFSLLAGLAMLCILDKLTFNNTLLQVPVIAVFLLAAWFCKLDNDIAVIAMITVFYFFHWHKLYISAIIACAAAAVTFNAPGCLLAVLPLSMYNGRRGLTGRVLKHLFYVFYPLHFLILCLIRQYII